MVLVVLLTLVVGLGIAMLFQRHGVAALAARRQADDYIARHAGLGMRELISRWISTVRGKLAESLDEGGFAFSLEFTDGQRIDVYLRDAQGTALAETSGLTGRRREIVELMKFLLEQGPQDEQNPLLRRHGPSEISLASAKPEVLRALAVAIVGPEKATKVAEAIARRLEDRANEDPSSRRSTGGMNPRPDATLPVEQILRVVREEGVEPNQVAEFQAMLVATPTLWFVTAEVRGAGGRVVDRAGGLIEIDPARNDPFNQNGPFLTWETLPLDEGLEAGVGR